MNLYLSRVVWQLDRLGRSLKQLLTLLEDFNTSGIRLVSLIEVIDTTTSDGKLVCVHLRRERLVVALALRSHLKDRSSEKERTLD
ncbi:recombinase family protein [Trichocoleus sp. DQ-A3]|uniref:recombinase family protein n=1 Tax=Cyanophyceae TaxID=3028117 RepID=UPI0018EF933A|nr:recombinase family protein [Coleofasciculus sp. FACHB-125]